MRFLVKLFGQFKGGGGGGGEKVCVWVGGWVGGEGWGQAGGGVGGRGGGVVGRRSRRELSFQNRTFKEEFYYLSDDILLSLGWQTGHIQGHETSHGNECQDEEKVANVKKIVHGLGALYNSTG